MGDCAGSFAGAGWETWSHGHRQSQASPLCCRNSPRSICEASKPSSSTSTASSVSSPRLPSPPRPFPGEEMTPVVQLPLLLVVVVASTGGSCHHWPGLPSTDASAGPDREPIGKARPGRNRELIWCPYLCTSAGSNRPIHAHQLDLLGKQSAYHIMCSAC